MLQLGREKSKESSVSGKPSVCSSGRYVGAVREKER